MFDLKDYCDNVFETSYILNLNLLVETLCGILEGYGYKIEVMPIIDTSYPDMKAWISIAW